MQMMIKKIRVFLAASQTSQHFACILCLKSKWSVNIIKNDKCKQSEVLAFLVQNLGLLTFVIFYQIDWSLLFQAQYTSKMLGCLRSCQKNSNLFDHHLHEIFWLHSGTDYQTGPNFPNTILGRAGHGYGLCWGPGGSMMLGADHCQDWRPELSLGAYLLGTYLVWSYVSCHYW